MNPETARELLESVDPRLLFGLNLFIWAYLLLMGWGFFRVFIASKRRRLCHLPPVGWGIFLPLAVIGIFVFLSGLGAFIPVQEFEVQPVPFLILAGLAQIGSCLAGWWMAARSSGEPVTRVLGLELRRIPAGIFWGMISLFCLAGPFLLASLLVQGLFRLFNWTIQEQVLVEVFRENLDKPSWPVFFLTAAVVAPVAEEIMFRGFLYRALVNWTRFRWPPILLSGFLFSLFHFHVLAILPLWVVGIFLAAIYDRTGNLWSSIFLHAFFNSVQVLVMMYLY